MQCKPAQLNKVTVLLSTPALTSQTDRVEKIRSNGNPAENPSKLMCKDCFVRRGLIFKIVIK
jgi:hypothetical protein